MRRGKLKAMLGCHGGGELGLSSSTTEITDEPSSDLTEPKSQLTASADPETQVLDSWNRTEHSYPRLRVD
jgi:hypothetical protein